MYKFQIMLTEKCNLECPVCPKQNSFDIPKTTFWTYDFEDFKKQFTPQLLKNTEDIKLVGNMGDVIFYKKLYSLLEYISFHNSNMCISLHTNATTHSKTWWRILSIYLKKFRYSLVIIAIDGLQNTYHLYRKNGSFKNVLYNSVYLLQNGINVYWQYILMTHNKKDLRQAKRLSSLFDFASFCTIYPWVYETKDALYNKNNTDITNMNVLFSKINGWKG